MVTALREICDLRSRPPKINTNNFNRYCILSDEGSSVTAYCFSVPIYNNATKRLVRREFIRDKNLFRFCGSNSNGFVHHGKLILTNNDGGACIDLPCNIVSQMEERLICKSWQIFPTFNGVHIHCTTATAAFTLNIDRTFPIIRHCSKSFGIMKREFYPFLTVTPLFSTNSNNQRFPATIEYEKKDDQTYQVIIRATQGNSVNFELNLYEPKLFQDTTVESLHPNENNAYGGISFLGRTDWTGEQWLYSRLDLTKIAEFDSVRVKKMLLHLPRWNGVEKEILIFKPVSQFCSFKSNWENKIDQTELDLKINLQDKYLTADVTKLFTNPTEQRIIQTSGLILKPKILNEDFIGISTSDNYTLPQILEIEYKY